MKDEEVMAILKINDDLWLFKVRKLGFVVQFNLASLQYSYSYNVHSFPECDTGRSVIQFSNSANKSEDHSVNLKIIILIIDHQLLITR